MKILILGGSGFVGKNLTAKLVSDGHQVGVFCRKEFDLKLDNVEIINGDFSDLSVLEKHLQNYEVVIHLISSKVPATSMLDPVDDIQTNLINSVKFIQLMQAKKIKKIIYVSSGGTIYKPSFSLNSEASQLMPSCSYGAVKLAIENYLNIYEKIFDLELVILRVSNPYGPFGSKTDLQGVVGNFIKKIKKNEPIEVWGDGSDVRDFIYIDDLISAIVRSLHTSHYGTFNIGSGIGTSIIELIRTIEMVTGHIAKINFKNSHAFQVKYNVLDIKKANQLLGWSPKISLLEGCNLYNDWL